MNSRCHRLATLVIAVSALSQVSPAYGYAMKIHETLTDRALSDSAWLLSDRGPLRPPSERDLAAFRRWLYDQVLSLNTSNPLRKRFLSRYPTPRHFTIRAFRELLAFNVNARSPIWSIGRAHRPGISARSLLVRSSADPDRDGRNRDRLAFKPDGRTPLVDAHGRPVPHDPSTLNMGQLKGLSSQGHAHYGLPDYDFSDDPDVLKSDPKRFLIKTGYPNGPVLTLAADMAQMHTDLAILAHWWGGRGARYLTVSFAGQAFHYIQDVGNQIHTVQVGSYAFFRDAKIQYWLRALLTAGGYLGPLKPFTSVGVDILGNHHILIEQLTAKRMDEASSAAGGDPYFRKVLTELSKDSEDFGVRIDSAIANLKSPSTFAAGLTRAIIAVSAPEGPDAYQHMRAVGCGRLSVYGYKFPDDTDDIPVDPDTMVCHGNDDEGRAHLDALYRLQGVAFRRVTTALRRYDRNLGALLNQPVNQAARRGLLTRFLRARLDLLDAAEARRADYLANPPKPTSGSIREPAWLIGEIAFLLILLLLVWWRSRGGRSQADDPTPESSGISSPDTLKEENMS